MASCGSSHWHTGRAHCNLCGSLVSTLVRRIAENWKFIYVLHILKRRKTSARVGLLADGYGIHANFTVSEFQMMPAINQSLAVYDPLIFTARRYAKRGICRRAAGSFYGAIAVPSITRCRCCRCCCGHRCAGGVRQ